MPEIKKPKSLKDKLKNVKPPKPKPKSPVWGGPCGAGPNGGVTQSLLARFLCCRERFRLLVVEGLKPADAFEPHIEFGNMWHCCEEQFALMPKAETILLDGFFQPLLDYGKELCKRYPMDREKIDHWYQVCKALFPLYVAHWAEHPDVQTRTSLLAEQVFDVPYPLPSGRTVRLRGKWDSVDNVGGDIWLMENKTKSSIDGQKLARQLSFDLQTMTYIVALNEYRWEKAERHAPRPITGVRYNVIRRSKHVSVESMLKKIDDDRRAGRMDEWFSRWNVTVTPADVARFRRECLDPVLEQLCDDWEWWAYCHEIGRDPFRQDCIWRSAEGRERGKPDQRSHVPRHFRMPYGIYNPVTENGYGDVDHYMNEGSEVGLQRATNLFPELV